MNRNTAGKKAWDRAVQRTLRRRRIGRLIDSLRESLRPVMLVTPVGAVPATQVGVQVEVINRVLVRITKGFLHITHPEVDRSRLDFDVTQLDQFKLNSIAHSGVVEKFTHYATDNGVYRHWRAMAMEDTRVGMWVHLFYDAAAWIVRHKPGDGRITVYGVSNWEHRVEPSSADVDAPC